jgi:gas vesicle protein
MPPQDTSDFLAAFAVGTVLGIGATLLLRPEPRSAKERLMRELRPRQRQLRGGRAVVPVADRPRARSNDVSSDAISAGRELLAEFRAEVRRIVADARSELRDAAEPPAKRRRPRRETAGAGHGAEREGR